MVILITGGLGFVGSHLTKHILVNTKEDLIILDNLSTGSKTNVQELLSKENYSRVEIIKETVENIDNLNFQGLSKVFHLASHASPIDFHTHSREIMMTNSLGTKKVLDIALNNNATFILASTSEIYGDPKVHPQNEDYYGNVNPLGIRACYDESKRFAEALTITYKRNYGIDTRILRIFNAYGTNMRIDDGRVVPTFLKQALTNKPITIRGNGEQTRSFCYISDLVKGIYSVADSSNLKHDAYNIGNPEEIRIIDLAEEIKQITCSNSELRFIEELGDEPRKRRPDITRIKADTNWFPKISLKEGLRMIVPHYRNILKRIVGGSE